MYHEFNSYKLSEREVLSLDKTGCTLKYEAFILGDFIVSFGISLKSGELMGEMCLHGGGTPAYIFDFKGNEVYTRYTNEKVADLTDKRIDLAIHYSVERRRFDIYVNGSVTVFFIFNIYATRNSERSVHPTVNKSATVLFKKKSLIAHVNR